MASAGPLLLAFETATSATSVALLRGEELIDEEASAPDRAAAENLLPAVDALLRRAGADATSVDAFAISIGPGSFTRLRIGIATVKGLAFGTARPVAPVGTLEALARAAPGGGDPVVAMLDARRGEVYAAAYEAAGGEPCAVLAEGVYTAEDLVRRLPRRCVLVGEGAALMGDRIREALGDGVRVVPAEVAEPSARHVGVLGARRLARGRGIEAADLMPRYLRRAEAEVQRTGRRFEAAAETGGSGNPPGSLL